MYEDAVLIETFKKNLDTFFQEELCLKQTDKYWEMLTTMSTKAVEGRNYCIAKGKFDGMDYLETLELLTMDDIGIPDENATKEMFELVEQKLCWTNWYNTLDTIPSYRKKIWTFWIKKGRDYLSVLMNI